MTLLLDEVAAWHGATLDRLKASVRETAALLRPIDRVRLIAVHETIDQVFDWQPAARRRRWSVSAPAAAPRSSTASSPR